MKYIHETVFPESSEDYLVLYPQSNYATDMPETLLISTIRNKNPPITHLFWPEQIQVRSEKSQSLCSKLADSKEQV